jgi:hypothetical protein
MHECRNRKQEPLPLPRFIGICFLNGKLGPRFVKSLAVLNSFTGCDQNPGKRKNQATSDSRINHYYIQMLSHLLVHQKQLTRKNLYNRVVRVRNECIQETYWKCRST